MKIIQTADGSHTLYNKGLDEHYHSVHGAVTESQHIFINAGFRKCKSSQVRILEMGFGTGLNAFLTLIESAQCGKNVIYQAVEQNPVDLSTISRLNYLSFAGTKFSSLFLKLHDCTWDSSVNIADHFILEKRNADFVTMELSGKYDLIYFDAFSPDKQPELWTEGIFRKIYDHLNEGGMLTTYCSKGTVKRALKSAGFNIELLPGPTGKRHILRATK